MAGRVRHSTIYFFRFFAYVFCFLLSFIYHLIILSIKDWLFLFRYHYVIMSDCLHALNWVDGAQQKKKRKKEH